MGNRIYFASDFHLGVPSGAPTREREKKIVAWLEDISHDASEIYLLGDLFDFWFEYKTVVPKGFTRLLGKIAELTDKGIPVTIFAGNHDLWMKDYLEEEVGATVHRKPLIKEWNGKRFFISHGDGLGSYEKGYNIIKSIFENKFCQRLFSGLHPYFGIKIAHFWSRKSRKTSSENNGFKGAENEWLFKFAKTVLEKEHIDYFVFGHRHLPLDLSLNGEENESSNGVSRYINLGDWITHNSYACFDGKELELKYFK